MLDYVYNMDYKYDYLIKEEELKEIDRELNLNLDFNNEEFIEELLYKLNFRLSKMIMRYLSEELDKEEKKKKVKEIIDEIMKHVNIKYYYYDDGDITYWYFIEVDGKIITDSNDLLLSDIIHYPDEYVVLIKDELIDILELIYKENLRKVVDIDDDRLMSMLLDELNNELLFKIFETINNKENRIYLNEDEYWELKNLIDYINENENNIYLYNVENMNIEEYLRRLFKYVDYRDIKIIYDSNEKKLYVQKTEKYDFSDISNDIIIVRNPKDNEIVKYYTFNIKDLCEDGLIDFSEIERKILEKGKEL